jgi:hypothetical protein
LRSAACKGGQQCGEQQGGTSDCGRAFHDGWRGSRVGIKRRWPAEPAKREGGGLLSGRRLRWC